MKRKIIDMLILIVIFIVGLIGFSLYLNRESKDMTTQMESAAFPVVTLKTDAGEMNRLFGYDKAMDVKLMRESITPVPSDGKVKMFLHSFGKGVENVYYEVLYLDGTSFSGRQIAKKMKKEENVISTNLDLSSVSASEQEYVLSITVQTMSKQFVHYYTRVKSDAGLNVAGCLEFANNFHEASFDQDRSDEIQKYLEVSEEAAGNSYANVNIHSPLQMIQWGELSPDVIKKPVPSVVESNAASSTIVMEYDVSGIGDNGAKDYYHVREYYRIRYTSSRVYLLNFERTMNQYFIDEAQKVTTKGITLGITEGSVNYKENKSGDTIVFEQVGALWAYHKMEDELVQVFSFYGDNTEDIRNTFNGHSIGIIDVDKKGNVYFTVSGYMNRGQHEGQVGSALYYYDNEKNSIQELLFIPSKKDYQVVKGEMDTPVYVSKDSYFYIYYMDTFYEINLESGKVKKLAKDLKEGQFIISEDGRMAAWQSEGEAGRATVITVMDLKTRSKQVVGASAGEFVKPIGFVGEDFAYGTAREEDINPNALGAGQFPMYSIKIQDKQANLVKQYEIEGTYVTEVEQVGKTLNLTCVAKAPDGGFLPNGTDSIMNNEVKQEQKISVETFATNLKQLQVRLTFRLSMKKTNPKILWPKEIVSEENYEIELDGGKQEEEFYYAYGNGQFMQETNSLAKAIQIADSGMGVVVNAKGEYVWERGNRSVRKDIYAEMPSVETLNQIFAGESEFEVMSLGGCTLDQVLYMVNKGTPVLAINGQGQKVYIVGYDALNVTLWTPGSDPVKGGLKDTTAMFAAAGNQFSTYQK